MKINYLISIVVPLYNEEESIETLYSELFSSLSGYKFEIIFISDGSFDKSVEIIKNIIKTVENVYLIELYKNYGKSAALSEGFKYCKGDYIVTLDADLQDDPAEIPELLNLIISSDFDIISV